MTKKHIPTLIRSLLTFAIANSSHGQIKIIVNETDQTVAFGGTDSGTPERILAPFFNTYENVAGWETGSFDSVAEVGEAQSLIEGVTVSFEALAYPSNGSEFQVRLHFLDTSSTTIKGTNTAYTQSEMLLSESEWNTIMWLDNGQKLTKTDGAGFSDIVVVKESSETFDYVYDQDSDSEWVYDFATKAWGYAKAYPWVHYQRFDTWAYVAEHPWLFIADVGWAYMIAGEEGSWIYIVDKDEWFYLPIDGPDGEVINSIGELVCIIAMAT